MDGLFVSIVLHISTELFPGRLSGLGVTYWFYEHNIRARTRLL